MAVVITATAQTAWPTRVAVGVTGLTIGDDLEIYRVVAGVRTLVREGLIIDSPGTGAGVIDAEIPFGVGVSYVARVNGVDADTDGPTTYTLDGGKVAVTDAVSGEAAEVVIMSWPAKERARQFSSFVVNGKNVVVAGPLAESESDVELFVDTAAAASDLKSVVESATQGIVQIRQAGGHDDEDGYYAVTTMTMTRYSQDGEDPRRTFVLHLVEVDAWAEDQATGAFTYADLLAHYTPGGTYADLLSDYSTYLAVRLADWS